MTNDSPNPDHERLARAVLLLMVPGQSVGMLSRKSQMQFHWAPPREPHVKIDDLIGRGEGSRRGFSSPSASPSLPSRPLSLLVAQGRHVCGWR